MNRETISDIHAEEILDSRGNPTLQVTVLAGAARGSFGVPSGASTGAHEAHELRDGGARFGGKGVHKAIQKIRGVIAPALLGTPVTDQKKIDQILLELDGTKEKKNLGGNAMIGVSIACAKAAGGPDLVSYLRSCADIKPSRREPLLFMNLINGGKHAHTRIAVQEYHVVPQVTDVREALEIGVAVQQTLRELLLESSGPSAVGYGDEGGFAPDLESARVPLELLSDAIQKTGAAGRVRLSLDVAASSLYTNGTYHIDGHQMSPDNLMQLYAELIRDFNLFSIEDPFQEDDFEHFAALQAAHPKCVIVGDDLTVTHAARITEATRHSSIQAVIIKPNQVGTLTETLEAMRLAREQGVECIVSHRSAETNDDFIADLAYAFSSWGLKAGAPQRGERVAKYNRLMHLTATAHS